MSERSSIFTYLFPRNGNKCIREEGGGQARYWVFCSEQHDELVWHFEVYVSNHVRPPFIWFRLTTCYRAIMRSTH